MGLCAFTDKGPGSIPGEGTRILQAAQRGQKKKKISKALKPVNPKMQKWGGYSKKLIGIIVIILATSFLKLIN